MILLVRKAHHRFVPTHTKSYIATGGFAVLAELDRDGSRGLGSAVCLSTQSISAHLPGTQMS